MPPPTQEGENVQYSGTEAVRERRAKRLGAFGEKQETGEQMRKIIMKLRKQIKKDKPTVRGQKGETWKKIVAMFRSNKGTKKPKEEAENDYRSPMSRAFNEPKDRRMKDTGEGKKKKGERARAATDGWNEEDHAIFTKIAASEGGEDDHLFLITAQKLLPHMLHSEIVERQRSTKIIEGRRRKKRKTEGKTEAKKERSEESNSEGDEEEEEPQGKEKRKRERFLHAHR